MTELHSFQRSSRADGGQPNGPLVQANDGNFYGTTRAGGANRCDGLDNFCGAVFRVAPSGQESVLYSFGASATDGYRPSGPLIQGGDGALYGVTAFGGAHGGGTIFRIALDGTYTLLHSFAGSASDGHTPTGGLVQARDGNFYGTTASGGANQCHQIPQAGGNCGTVFRMTPSGETTILHSFGSGPVDGVTPNGSLFQASDGYLYGTTLNGGANACSSTGATNNCGTAFRITTAGALTILHSFGGSATAPMAPHGPLIQGSDGAFYGATVSGGGGRCGGLFGCGTVYRMTAAGQITVLYAFSLVSTTDGYGPSPVLIQAKDGNFYGTTGSGGSHSGDLNGTVFRLTATGVKTILHSFGPLNTGVSHPVGGLIQGQDGAFYGITAYSGSAGGSGTVFRLSIQ